MNGAKPGKPTCCPRSPKSTTVNLFQVDPSWYERYWWSDPAPRRRSAFGYFHRILSDCPKWWVHYREALAALDAAKRRLWKHLLEGLGGELDK